MAGVVGRQRVRALDGVLDFGFVQPVGGADGRELTAKQVEFLPKPVQYPVDLAGLVAAQCLGELHRVDVLPGDTGGGQHGRRGGVRQRGQHLAAAEEHAADGEQHDPDQHEHHKVQEYEGHTSIVPDGSDTSDHPPRRNCIPCEEFRVRPARNAIPAGGVSVGAA